MSRAREQPLSRAAAKCEKQSLGRVCAPCKGRVLGELSVPGQEAPPAMAQFPQQGRQALPVPRQVMAVRKMGIKLPKRGWKQAQPWVRNVPLLSALLSLRVTPNQPWRGLKAQWMDMG